MSVTQQAVAIGRGYTGTRPARRGWFGGLHGADYIWAFAFAVPLRDHLLRVRLLSDRLRTLDGQRSGAVLEDLITDPRYLTAVVNTLLYVAIGVNVKMFLAFMMSGFFIRKRWWSKALLVVFILPWATPHYRPTCRFIGF